MRWTIRTWLKQAKSRLLRGSLNFEFAELEWLTSLCGRPFNSAMLDFAPRVLEATLSFSLGDTKQ